MPDKFLPPGPLRDHHQESHMLKKVLPVLAAIAVILIIAFAMNAKTIGEIIATKNHTLDMLKGLQKTGPYKHIKEAGIASGDMTVPQLQAYIDSAFVDNRTNGAITVLGTLRRANVGAEVLGQPHAEKFRVMSIAEAKHRMPGVEESLKKGCPIDASYRLHHVDLLTELFGGAERHIETYTGLRRRVNAVVAGYRDEPIETTRERNRTIGCSMG